MEKKQEWKTAIWALMVCVPVILLVAAGFCGFYGKMIGFTLEKLAFLAWFPFGTFYLYRFLFRKTYFKTLNLFCILFNLCGIYFSLHATVFLDSFEARLKDNYKDTHTMQFWATGILEKSDRKDHRLDQHAYPNWLQINNFPEPMVYVVNGPNIGTHGYVEVVWGGPVIMFGLVIGGPETEKKGRPWTNGICFFAVPEPPCWRKGAGS